MSRGPEALKVYLLYSSVTPICVTHITKVDILSSIHLERSFERGNVWASVVLRRNLGLGSCERRDMRHARESGSVCERDSIEGQAEFNDTCDWGRINTYEISMLID